MTEEKALALFNAMCNRRDDLRTLYADTYMTTMAEAIRCIRKIQAEHGIDEVQAAFAAGKACKDEKLQQFLLVAPIEIGLRGGRG